jgi:DNA invertase Pin-like site-specific DNA recombinase
MTRAAIYVRKSTSAGLEQEFNSLDAQRESCANYARSRGWTVLPETYEDGGYTGANIDRPAFQRLLADIDAKKIDVVVVYKVDRLSRSLLDFAKVMDRFQAAGVAFVSVTQNFSTADAMGRLTLNMLMSFAEFEREMIAERTRDKIAAARRRGKWTGGIAPLGYRVESSKLVVVESEARVVRQVFAMYLEHRSLFVLMRELAARGWARRGARWTKDSLVRILRNPVYAGRIRHGEQTHPGEHEAIVAVESFERVQDAMARAPSSAPRRNPEYVLRGILRCGGCGAAMTTASTRKRGRTYRFYRCVTRDKRGRSACSTRPLAADTIESLVLDRLRQRAPEIDSGAVERAFHERLDADRAHLDAVRTEVPPKVAALSRQMGELFERLPALKPAARAIAEERLEKLDIEQKDLEAQLVVCERRARSCERDAVDVQWVTRALADLDSLWEGMTIANRGRLVAGLVARVVVDDRRGEVEIVMADEAAAPA